MWSASWRGSDARAMARATIKTLLQHIGLHITLSSEHERLRAEHAFYADRVAELEQHNRLLVDSATQMALKLQERERELTESSTQRALKLQERERELTRARIDIATLSSENERLRAEQAFYAKRAAELEEHNRLLSENATAAERQLQEMR